MYSCPVILRIAINTPLRNFFDYLPPAGIKTTDIVPGTRMKVPFGKSGKKTGILVEITDKSDIDPGRLKQVTEILDQEPLVDRNLLKLMLWASHYYQHPVGEVILGNLPALIRQGNPAIGNQVRFWRLTQTGNTASDNILKNCPRQIAIFRFIKTFSDGVKHSVIQDKFSNCNSSLKQLQEKNLVEKFFREILSNPDCRNTPDKPVCLNNEQTTAINSVISHKNQYQAFLLNGVTGSGKTEVYINIIKSFITQGLQSLVLVPEIGLTPQFVEHFRRNLDTHIVVLHSGLGEQERMSSWLDARSGRAKVIIGTRSAIWSSCKKLGLVIVDEEHDLSYKQQDGFRYSARDLALIRGQQENIPVVLGSATPSMESLMNVQKKRYQELYLKQRAGKANMPEISILDIRGCRMEGAISVPLLTLIQQYLDKGQQILLFLNRRGYAPIMLCHNCGWINKCPRCEVQMTYHKSISRLYCHHCGHQERKASKCIACNAGKIVEIGHGTQRIMETLEIQFPEARILRIDRDSTRRKGSMQNMLNLVQNGDVDILVGTQMLAKGHHFPRVTLVGIIDADQGLFNTDFRSSERMSQIITQVSGRSGRSDNPGLVVLQTHYPDHPILTTLSNHNYEEVSSFIMQERKLAKLPPYSYQVLLRADANDQTLVNRFLNRAKNQLDFSVGRLDIYGPFSAQVEKRAGRYRMQLLLQSENRQIIRKILPLWINKLGSLNESRKVRWSVDVDPQEMM